jgi:tetratricopeptide (TPR) repeat protein
MSRTLNLIRRLLARGRKLHKLGVDHEAQHTLSRLSGFRELPAGVTEEVQRRLAELLLKQRKYARARRHLAALLAHQPDNPHYHYLMARAVEKDLRGDPKRAVEHYRQALAIEPDHPRYLTDFGLACLRVGRNREGLEALRRALELAPADAVVVGRVADGLGQRGRYREALRAVRVAMFRNPHEARFRRLWQDVRFRQAQAAQQAVRRSVLAPPDGDGPALLPFVLPADASAPACGGLKLYRHDSGPTIPHPHFPRPARTTDQKHAQ